MRKNGNTGENSTMGGLANSGILGVKLAHSHSSTAEPFSVGLQQYSNILVWLSKIEMANVECRVRHSAVFELLQPADPADFGNPRHACSYDASSAFPLRANVVSGRRARFLLRRRPQVTV